MSFDDDVILMNDKLLSVFGKTVVYASGLDSTVALTALFNQSYQVQADGFATTSALVSTVEARISDLGGVPSRGDTFTIDDVEYVIDHVSENNGLWVKCILGEVV